MFYSPGRSPTMAGCVPDLKRRLVAVLSKPAPGGGEVIEAQIRDEIAVMQGVMTCKLRQDEHLVRIVAPEVRRVIEVRISEPGVRAIAVLECAFEVGDDLGLRTFLGSYDGARFILGVCTQIVGNIRHMIQDLGKRANVLCRPVAVLDSGIAFADFMILSCILLRKMDNVIVSGCGAVVGLGRFGEI